MQNEMRDRLIESIDDYISTVEVKDWYSEELDEGLADHLLADGWIRPPCKIGQKAWLVFTPKYPANPKDKGKWFIHQDGVQRIIYGAKGLSIETWNMGTIPAKEIGKKLFFSEEEAEKALKEKNNEK